MSTATNRAKSSRAPEPTNTGSPGPSGSLWDIPKVFTDAKTRREYIEMVAFVLVLVCFLRLFGAEAYVIPTGSMAPTLLGAHKVGICPQCGQVNYINASHEAEEGLVTKHGVCQNCQNVLNFPPGGYAWGDRILADKLVYELRDPHRWDVAVFKYPGGIEGRGAGIRSARSNYIKRVVGLPNETVGIQFGDVFFKADGQDEFQIARKPPRVVMATRRLVYDNDRHAKDLLAEGVPPRWTIDQSSVWSDSDDGKSFSSSGEGEGWLAYRHLLRWAPTSPSLILDFEAYNTDQVLHNLGTNWVGDLMIECDLLPQTDEGSIVLELVEAERTFRCVFEMAADSVVLYDGSIEAARTENPLTAGKASQVRFANVDDQLILWVDNDLVFGAGVDVDVPKDNQRGPTTADFRPVRIGSNGARATVSGLKLFRDIYYRKSSNPNVELEPILLPRPYDETGLELLRAMTQSGQIREFSIKEHEYFVLGDNSPASADARDWRDAHAVDRRLILGRAIARYWPIVSFQQGWPTLKWKFVE